MLQLQSWSRFLRVPAPARLLLLSLGFHGILLSLPIPSPEPKLPDPGPETVGVRELPREQPPEQPKVVQPRNTASISSKPQASPPRLLASPPQSVLPIPAPSPQPPTPTVKASPKATISPAPSVTPSPSTSVPVSAFADFPHVSGVQSGCEGLGNCWQAEGMRLTSVSRNLQESLEAQRYEVQLVNDDAGIRVYELSKRGEKRYLSLFSTPERGTLYVLAAQPLTSENLQQAMQAKTKLSTILNDLTSVEQPQVIRENLSRPELFWATNSTQTLNLNPGITGDLLLVSASTPKRLFDETLAPSLQAQGFSVSEIKNYANGPVYEVKQGVFTRYLNLVPTRNGQGTVVVLWSNLPNG
ncbi:hypothetical protein [Leptolyngbya sp. FACHB-261]|uniref:hypothetical protein n=1 Tax=Leptolyngbya sp. FACHB-261 TaxID=2692806 RepID=UPI001682BD91|nr:hypothetical protein [Leptolyngbya sp. FACHB-261]MBD2103416.1 hypothetical protein [Leptolyngbya sp. FACHB-261]